MSQLSFWNIKLIKICFKSCFDFVSFRILVVNEIEFTWMKLKLFIIKTKKFEKWVKYVDIWLNLLKFGSISINFVEIGWSLAKMIINFMKFEISAKKSGIKWHLLKFCSKLCQIYSMYIWDLDFVKVSLLVFSLNCTYIFIILLYAFIFIILR